MASDRVVVCCMRGISHSMAVDVCEHSSEDERYLNSTHLLVGTKGWDSSTSSLGQGLQQPSVAESEMEIRPDKAKVLEEKGYVLP